MELIVFGVILAVILIAVVIFVSARPGSTPTEALSDAVESARYSIGDMIARITRAQPGDRPDGDRHCPGGGGPPDSLRRDGRGELGLAQRRGQRCGRCLAGA